jgi:type I restriction enzyme S subunit
MMSLVTRVRTDHLLDRIDASYYRRDFVENQSRLSRSPVQKLPLSELVTAGRRAVYFGTTTLERDEAPSDWVPFLTSDDIDDSGCSISLDARRRVAPEFADRYPNGVLRANELLVKVKGPNQTTAYQESLPPHRVQVSGTIWGSLVRKDRVDPYYLVAVLSSPYASLARTRLRTNLNVEFLSPDDLLTVILPVPIEFSAQTYIGDKLQQAERLRERSRTIERTARSEYDQHLRNMGLVEVPQSRCYRACLMERLDPAYYDPRWSSVLDSDWFRKASQPLEKFIREGTYGVLPDSATYGSGNEWLIRATDLDSCVSDPFAGVQVPESEVEDKARIREHDLLLEVKGAIERCALASGPAIGKFVNGTVYRFAPKDIDIGYLAIHLTGRVKQMYCRRVAVNNIIQYLNLDCIRQLPVIRLGVEIEKELGSCFITASRFKVVSDSLVATAKLLVEALIEGKVTETELKEAQEALVRGDTGPDCSILQRLTRNGIDVPNEPPLFPNLDDLYTALEESADASVTVEARG